MVTHSDDLIVAANTCRLGDRVRGDLLKLFPGKDLGRLSSFCGVEIDQQPHGIRLSLRHYLDTMFKLFNVRPLPPGITSSLPSQSLKSECPETEIPWVIWVPTKPRA